MKHGEGNGERPAGRVPPPPEASADRYRALFENSPTALWEEDFSSVKELLDGLFRDGLDDLAGYLEDHPEEVERCAGRVRVVDVNTAALRLLECDDKETLLRGLPEIFHEGSYEIFRRQVCALASGATVFEADVVNRTFRGSKLDVRMRVSLAPGAEEDWSHVFVSLTDIGDWKRAQAQLQLHHVAMESAADAIFITRRDGRIEWVNRAFTRLSGYTRTEAVGQTPRLLKSDRHGQSYFRHLWQTLLAGRVYRNRTINRHKSGALYTVEQSITPIFDDEGEITHFVAVQQDITDRLESEEQLVRLVQQDFLTGLPNRYAFTELLDRETAIAERRGRSVAVLLLDIDHFKDINDAYGHTVGDALLVSAGERLQESLRSIDTVARLGGDEFAVLQTDVVDLEDTVALAERLMRVLEMPFEVEEHEVQVTASIGVAVAEPEAADAAQMIQQADVALYRAKQDGRSTFRFHTGEMDHEVEERLTLSRDLRQALENNEFFLVFQPQIDLGSARVAALEALLRWRHPERGLVPPARFIPIAESNGQIVPLGEWVLRTACETLRRLHERGYPELSMAVNVSALQLKARGFAAAVRGILHQTGVAPRALELELTESVLMHQTRRLKRAVEELHELGVRFSVDDFGTGYSSMMYLRQFEVDKLKIDRFFLERVESSPSDAAIVSAIIALGNQLGLQVLAEGVERESQIEFLQANGCAKVQGFYFSRPIPADDVRDLLDCGSERIRAGVPAGRDDETGALARPDSGPPVH